MAEVVIAEIEVGKLTTPAFKLLKAAVLLAIKNAGIQRHTIPMEDLCQLAGLPVMLENEMARLLTNARMALGIIDVIDTDAPDKDDAPYGSWQLLSEAEVQGRSVSFQVCPFTFDERIRGLLMPLRPELDSTVNLH